METREQNHLHPHKLRPGVRTQGGNLCLFVSQKAELCLRVCITTGKPSLRQQDARGGSGTPTLCPDICHQRGAGQNPKPSIAWGVVTECVTETLEWGGFLMPYRDPTRGNLRVPEATALNGSFLYP